MTLGKSKQRANFTKLRRISEPTTDLEICLFLGEVDLVTKTEGHPLWEKGKMSL